MPLYYVVIGRRVLIGHGSFITGYKEAQGMNKKYSAYVCITLR